MNRWHFLAISFYVFIVHAARTSWCLPTLAVLSFFSPFSLTFICRLNAMKLCKINHSCLFIYTSKQAKRLKMKRRKKTEKKILRIVFREAIIHEVFFDWFSKTNNGIQWLILELCLEITGKNFRLNQNDWQYFVDDKNQFWEHSRHIQTRFSQRYSFGNDQFEQSFIVDQQKETCPAFW